MAKPKTKNRRARMAAGRSNQPVTSRGPLQRSYDADRGRVVEVDGVASYDDKGRSAPTPERIRQMDSDETLDHPNPAEIDSAEQPIGRVPRFRRVPHLDRWHKAKIITQRQWWAGDAYRRLYEGMQNLPRVVASYGERTSAGEPDYGLARTDAQARRRVSFRAARSMLPLDVMGLIERLLLRNDLPEYRGRKQMSAIADARRGLDALADHFEHRRSDQSLVDRTVDGGNAELYQSLIRSCAP